MTKRVCTYDLKMIVTLNKYQCVCMCACVKVSMRDKRENDRFHRGTIQSTSGIMKTL